MIESEHGETVGVRNFLLEKPIGEGHPSRYAGEFRLSVTTLPEKNPI